jgi:hypothetical protein
MSLSGINYGARSSAMRWRENCRKWTGIKCRLAGLNAPRRDQMVRVNVDSGRLNAEIGAFCEMRRQ